MAVNIRHVSVEEFETFIHLPENIDRRFEYIAGKIVEVVSNNYSSEIAMLIGSLLTVHVRQKKLGRVTGADGGYIIAGNRYIPDVAFISIDKQPEPSLDAYNPNPPDLVVEVLSPSNDATDMRIKVVNYLRVGATVWIINPDKQQVEVYAPNAEPYMLDINATLTSADVLPGFALPVKDIFPE